MKGEDKDQIMRAFAAGECQILVSTTVIEVGIDVANATVMIIEHGERFGLTQLHQLRGRVGRSSEKSFCILIAYPPLSQLARQRLQTMAKTNDGFEIAEVDLKLRGAGEFFGVRQHGQLRLKIADIIDDLPILNAARREAFELVAQDPTLTAIKFRAVRDFFNQYYRNRFQLGQVA